jgi:hypothetical protein
MDLPEASPGLSMVIVMSGMGLPSDLETHGA